MAKPVGPYSPFVKSGEWVVTSGQIGLNDDGQLVEGGIEAQARQTLENLKSVLESAGMSVNDVKKTLVFLTNMDDYAVMNQIYSEVFGEIKPARSAVAVAALPLGALIEIEAWASRS